MSYPSNRTSRDPRRSYFDEESEQERGTEGHGRSHLSERDYRARGWGEEERDPREEGRFVERRRSSEPYRGERDRDEMSDEHRAYEQRQRGFAPYPYGEERRRFRNLEDWQQPWELGAGRETRIGEGFSRHEPRRFYESRADSERMRRGGPYRGRGPKGYQRSDERVREDLCERLMDAADVDASEISVEVSSGEVTLAGSVPDRRMKREAEDIAEDVMGVKQVHNALRVTPAEHSGAERDAGYGATGMHPPVRH